MFSLQTIQKQIAGQIQSMGHSWLSSGISNAAKRTVKEVFSWHLFHFSLLDSLAPQKNWSASAELRLSNVSENAKSSSRRSTRDQSFYQEELLQVCPSLMVPSASAHLNHTSHMGLKVGWSNMDPTLHCKVRRCRFLSSYAHRHKLGFVMSRQSRIMSFP